MALLLYKNIGIEIWIIHISWTTSRIFIFLAYKKESSLFKNEKINLLNKMNFVDNLTKEGKNSKILEGKNQPHSGKSKYQLQ